MNEVEEQPAHISFGLLMISCLVLAKSLELATNMEWLAIIHLLGIPIILFVFRSFIREGVSEAKDQGIFLRTGFFVVLWPVIAAILLFVEVVFLILKILGK